MKERGNLMNNELKAKLAEAKSLDEAKEILKGREDIDAERAWREIENHRSSKSERLDFEELDAVSGGADRDWEKDGCAATCEWTSWCGSNDNCVFFDVTYSNFWRTCPDGHDHVFDNDGNCVRCGYSAPFNPDTGPRG